jgi:hypothetical protein
MRVCRFHFDSLAHDNASLSTTILTSSPTHPIPSQAQSLSQPAVTPKPLVLSGLQSIHKFSHNASGAPRPGHENDVPDQVWIGMALWRCWRGSKKADLVLSVNVNLSAVGGDDEKRAVEIWFSQTAEQLRIEDWGLFGDSEE